MFITVSVDFMDKLKVPELKELLKKKNLPTDGLKAVLVKRLEEAVAAEQAQIQQTKAKEASDKIEAAALAKKRKIEEEAAEVIRKTQEEDDKRQEAAQSKDLSKNAVRKNLNSEEESESSESEGGAAGEEGTVKKKAGSDDESSDDSGEGDSDSSVSSDEDVQLKFRNYHPADKKLKAFRLKREARKDQNWVLGELKEILACAVKTQDINLDVAPKKANWDLKRDLAPKLEILNKKTERAVLEMIRAKAEQQEKEESSSDDSSESDSSDDERG